MNVAIVGAGALGQPFGYHLSEGGADVTYVVKPKHLEECQGGFRLHRYRIFGGPRSVQFDDFQLETSYERVAEKDWDQVWLCISSTALSGEWLPEFLEAIGDTTLVSIQPGLEDRAFLEERYPAERIVSGRVSMIAWNTPLAGEELPANDVAYFIPPAQPITFGVAMERAREVADLLSAGGCPAGVHDEILSYTAFSSAVLETAVAGIELAGWSLREFRRGKWSRIAADAGAEALEIVGRKYDKKPPLSLRLGTKPLTIKMGLPFATAATPFDLEAYLEEHFTKVGDQTREELAEFVAAGEQQGLAVESLSLLLDELGEPPLN